MEISPGLKGIAPLSRQDIGNMSVSAALMHVNLARMSVHGNTVKAQAADVNARNMEMDAVNELKRLATTLLAEFAAGASSSDPLPAGDALDDFKAAAAAMGYDVKHVTNKGQLAAEADNIKSKLDRLSGTQHLELTRLQEAANQYNEGVSMTTNQLKSDHELNSAIINNMRS